MRVQHFHQPALLSAGSFIPNPFGPDCQTRITGAKPPRTKGRTFNQRAEVDWVRIKLNRGSVFRLLDQLEEVKAGRHQTCSDNITRSQRDTFRQEDREDTTEGHRFEATLTSDRSIPRPGSCRPDRTQVRTQEQHSASHLQPKAAQILKEQFTPKSQGEVSLCAKHF